MPDENLLTIMPAAATMATMTETRVVPAGPGRGHKTVGGAKSVVVRELGSATNRTARSFTLAQGNLDAIDKWHADHSCANYSEALRQMIEHAAICKCSPKAKKGKPS